MTTTTLWHWLINKQDAPLEVRKDASARVGVHAVLLTVLIWYLCRIVPIVGEVFSGFGGKLPWLVQTLIDHAEFVREWFYLLVPTVIVGLVVDYRYYIYLYLKSGKKSARLWAYGITFLLSSAIGFYVFALCSAFFWRMSF